MEQRRKQLYRASWKGNMWVVDDNKKKHKNAKIKKRTLKTREHKINRIKKQYNRLSKSDKFIKKYPTVDSFIKTFNLREVK